ncbi:hypothetical protein IU445_18910 [Nocardia farcinica]|nr:hypothetical protein [Nocardia farcinica]
MTSRPDPTWVYHITRIEHIASMIEHGVLSDRGLMQDSVTGSVTRPDWPVGS